MGDTAKDMTGFRSGRLVAVSRSSGPNPKRAYWLCQCDCGQTVTVMGKYLRNGDVQSCGCLNRQGIDGPSNYRHGHAPATGVSKTYTTWSSMIDRCENPNNAKYADYGGRGITVCPQWHDFKNFLADMGEKPKGMSIDRFPNNDGGYELSNCRWATMKEQQNNTRRNRRITFNGETLTFTEWSQRLGINSGEMFRRLEKFPLEVALSAEDILRKPPLQINNRKHGETIVWPVSTKELGRTKEGKRAILKLECGHSIALYPYRNPASIECPECSELWRNLVAGKSFSPDANIKPATIELLRQEAMRLGRISAN